MSLVVSVPSVSAQVTLPDILYGNAIPPAHAVTPDGAVLDLRATAHQLVDDVPSNRDVFPTDSIHAAVIARAVAWLNVVRTLPLAALTVNGASRVAVMAGQDSLARAQIATRLATPSLSIADRGYTLLLSTLAFTDTTHPPRLAVAEQYCAQLDSLPATVAGLWQYRAHAALSNAYAALGRTDQFVTHGVRALMSVPKMAYIDRWATVRDPMGFELVPEPNPYIPLAMVLTLTPQGRAQLDTLTRALIEAMHAPDSLVADRLSGGAYQQTGESIASMIQARANVVTLIGRPAPPLHVTNWWNAAALTSALTSPNARPDTTSDTSRKSMPLNDGIVRVLLFAQFGQRCCLTELRGLERVHRQFPTGVQVIFVTSTTGHWGYRIFSPADETRRLRDMYLTTYRISVPIALWAGEKKRLPQGWFLPEPSPDLEAYHVPSNDYEWPTQSPYVVIVDRHGIIRRTLTHFEREHEAVTVAFIRTLLQER